MKILVIGHPDAVLGFSMAGVGGKGEAEVANVGALACASSCCNASTTDAAGSIVRTVGNPAKRSSGSSRIWPGASPRGADRAVRAHDPRGRDEKRVYHCCRRPLWNRDGTDT